MKKIKITNELFVNGPLILSESGYYYLCEDIYINFLKNKGDIWEHNKNNNFGFTAGIIITGTNITLDLKGYSIQQSIQDFCLQRFFALIQLNNMPFNIGKGPILEQRKELNTGKNIIIKNGTLGLTSHQAILGNNNENVELKKININNFEVSGITLNAVKDLKFKYSKIEYSNNNIPITPHFSAFIFIFKLLQTIKIIENKDKISFEIDIILNKIKDYYQSYINIIYKSKNYNILCNELKNLKNDLFINYDNNTPCNMHGIKITGSNPSIHEFNNSVNKNKELNSIDTKIKNVNIENLTANVNEDLLLAYKNEILHIGAGVRVSFKFLTDKKISKFFINILELIQNLCEKFPSIKILTKTNINKNNLEIIKKIVNNYKLTNKEAENYGIVRNCDLMGHINKGTIGIRLGSSINCNLENINIKKIVNNGILNSKYNYYKEKYNIQNETILDSKTDGINNLTGSYSIGLISSGISNSSFNNLIINNIKSSTSKSIGVFINNVSNNIDLKKLHISNIESNNNINDSSTILIDEKSKKVNLFDISIN